MALDGKIITNPKVNKMLNLAIMCKTMRCLPSELRKEDYEEMEFLELIFNEFNKKNPLNFLMG